MFANQIAGKVAADLAVIGFASAAAAAGYEIAQVSVEDFPVESSALKSVVVTAAADKDIENFGTAAAVVEEPVACLTFVSENWHTYLAQLSSPLGFVKHQRYSACYHSGQQCLC